MRTLAIAALGALSALGATAARADDAQPTKPAARPYPHGITCAYIPDMAGEGYGVIDDKHLVVDGTGRKKFLVTLFMRCFDLQTTLAIRFDRHGSDLCTGDSIRAGHDRCRIQYVEEVTDSKDADNIVAARDAAEKEAEKAKH